MGQRLNGKNADWDKRFKRKNVDKDITFNRTLSQNCV